MTDARHPERWLTDRRFLRLSGDAYKLHSVALMWACSNRTDGFIDDEDVALLPGVDRGRVDELVKLELWRRHGDRWLMVEFERTQTSSNELAALDAMRRRDREAKARKRAEKKRALDDDPADCPPDTPDDVPRDGSAGAQRTGQGQDRTASGSEAEDNGLPDGACRSCGEPSAFLLAGYCRRGECTEQRRKDNAA